jgi:hypothetical protein
MTLFKIVLLCVNFATLASFKFITRPLSSSRFFSSQLSWDKTPFVDHRDVSIEVDDSDTANLKLLDTANCKTVVVSEEELKAKWIDICIDESRPNDLNSISLKRLVPLIIRDDAIVQLENQTAALLESTEMGEIFITEQELINVWSAASLEPMGRTVDKFTVEDALLLIDDDYMDEIMGEDSPTGSSKSNGLLALSSSLDDEVIDEEEEELVVTSQELQRLWTERSAVPWAPSQTFDEKLALLLLEGDDEDDDELIEMLSYEGEEEYKPVQYAPALYDTPVDDSKAFWNQYGGKHNQYLREMLKRTHDDLEDRQYNKPAWKKDRSFLSPDVETQDFLGDIMFSNTYLTQRIPANWEDPEKDEMSDTYLSTGTMAWPGEEETDFNLKTPVWEELKLPFGPNYHPPEHSMTARHVAAFETAEEEVEEEKVTQDDGKAVDWASFDFDGTDDSGISSGDDDSENDAAAKSAPDGEIDAFFKSFDKPAKSIGPLGGVDSGALDLADTELMNKAKRGNQESRLTNRNPSWRTPPEWLQTEEFATSVPFEVWSEHDSQWFEGADDEVWDEDVYFSQSMAHIMRVTDVYLEDHTRQNERNEDMKYWEKAVFKSVTGEDVMIDPIPLYLTPDIGRGVVYSDELIEMKGKMTLMPEIPEPEVAYVNDTFTHNEDMGFMNMVGTIRIQYDWQPDESLKPYLIEKEKIAHIQPVINYVNHAAKLLSTKDDVLVFHYKGNMRHLLGIRASMMRICKTCYPECTNIRLETTKRADKFDF